MAEDNTFTIDDEGYGYDELIHGDKVDFHALTAGLVKEPIGNDPLASLSAKGFLLHADEDPTLLNLLNDVREKRSEKNWPLTRMHEMGLALIHGPNYINIIKRGLPDYIRSERLTNAEAWKRMYQLIQTDYFDRYQEILMTKEVQTTMPNRGILFPFLIRTLFPGQAVTLGDFGVSANWVLARLACNGRCEGADPYRAQDWTFHGNEQSLIMSHAHEPVMIADAVGIDHTDPFADEESTNWFVSNMHLRDVSPQTVANTRKKIDLYRNITPVRFQLGNIIKPPIPLHSLDIGSELTVLYELPEGQRKQALRALSKRVKKDGYKFIQDYFNVQNGEPVFTKERGPFTYRAAVSGPVTNYTWMEIARFANSRCDVITNGEHTEQFMDAVTAH